MSPELLIAKNSPNISQWNLHDGYGNSFDKNVYPIRVFNARKGGTLIISLRVYKHDLEYLCRRDQGFKLILHTPGEVVKMSHQTFHVHVLKDTEVMIKPKYTITSQGLREYPPKQRNCFFSSERHLRFFKMYAHNNCKVECLANFTQTECGCVKFSMPRERGVRICGAESVKCYREAEQKLYGEDIIDGLEDKKAKRFRKKCNCLPGCTSIMYEAEIDRTQIDLEATRKSFNISLQNGYATKNAHHSIVH